MTRIHTHPGEVLREEFIEPLGLSANALAKALRVDAPRINGIVRERRAITPETAIRLGRYFGTTATFWLNLQTRYDMSKALAEKGAEIEREVQPRELVAA